MVRISEDQLRQVVACRNSDKGKPANEQVYSKAAFEQYIRPTLNAHPSDDEVLELIEAYKIIEDIQGNDKHISNTTMKLSSNGYPRKWTKFEIWEHYKTEQEILKDPANRVKRMLYGGEKLLVDRNGDPVLDADGRQKRDLSGSRMVSVLNTMTGQIEEKYMYDLTLREIREMSPDLMVDFLDPATGDYVRRRIGDLSDVELDTISADEKEAILWNIAADEVERQDMAKFSYNAGQDSSISEQGVALQKFLKTASRVSGSSKNPREQSMIKAQEDNQKKMNQKYDNDMKKYNDDKVAGLFPAAPVRGAATIEDARRGVNKELSDFANKFLKPYREPEPTI